MDGPESFHYRFCACFPKWPVTRAEGDNECYPNGINWSSVVDTDLSIIPLLPPDYRHRGNSVSNSDRCSAELIGLDWLSWPRNPHHTVAIVTDSVTETGRSGGTVVTNTHGRFSRRSARTQSLKLEDPAARSLLRHTVGSAAAGRLGLSLSVTVTGRLGLSHWEPTMIRVVAIFFLFFFCVLGRHLPMSRKLLGDFAALLRGLQSQSYKVV